MSGSSNITDYRSGLILVPALTIAIMIGPVILGMIGTIGPALGYFPALGYDTLDWNVFRDFFARPGIATSCWISLTTGLATAVISLALVMLICAGWHGAPAFRIIEHTLSPLLSIPHAAAAFSFAFLIAPSGWIVRMISPWLTGWDRPPDILIVQDPQGIALIAGLIIKESAFLLLVTLAALNQINSTQCRSLTLALGYGRVTGWFKIVFPQVYPQIRLPVYAVLAYSMSVVDVAIILGPSAPQTLAVQIVNWMKDPDLVMRFQAAAGAVVQCALVLAALGLWRGLEYAVTRLGRVWVMGGSRGIAADLPLRFGAMAMAGIIIIASALGIAGLMLWSMADLWVFPKIFPEDIGIGGWQRYGLTMIEPMTQTIVIAGISTLIAIVLVIGCLEAEYRHGLRVVNRSLWLLYVPLLFPQIAFLPGLQAFLLSTGTTVNLAQVIFAHLVFVLPYVFLSLADPFRAWDMRYGDVAKSLGAGANRVLIGVRLPMLLRPVLTAAAVGFAVSVGQYLPTLLISGGRYQTITTEALALASGGNRRLIGIYSLAQMAIALMPFMIAIWLPNLIWPLQQRWGRHD